MTKFKNVRMLRARVINWGRYADQTVDIKGGDALITGMNGVGKSILLDGLKYGYIWDNKFNSAANKASGVKKNGRTLLEYVHGDRRAEEEGGGILRPNSVVSYIIIEYYRPETDSLFVIGHCFESVTMDHLSEVCFYYDNASIEDFDVTENNNGKKEILPFAKMRLKGKLFSEYKDHANKSYYSRDAREINKIMTSRLGIKCSALDVRRIISTLSAFAANEMAGSGGVSGFCQRNILPEKKLDCIEQLISITKELDNLHDQLKGYEQKREKLQSVLASLEEYKESEKSYKLAVLVKKRHEIITLEKDINILRNRSVSLKHQIELLEANRPLLKKAKDDADSKYYEALNSDTYKNFDKLRKECEEDIFKLSASLRALNAEKDKLNHLADILTGSLSWFIDEYSGKRDIPKFLESLSDPKTDTPDFAMQTVQRLSDQKKETLNTLRSNEADLRREKLDKEKERVELTNTLAKLGNGDIQFMCGKTDMAQMRHLLQKEVFIRRKEKIEIRLFAELVSKLEDESWRNAIEAFLGARRYDLVILDTKKVDVVASVFRELCLETSPEYRGIEKCRLVYSDKLKQRATEEITPGSASEILVTSNVYGRLYANYLLNSIHLCDSSSELKTYFEGGITRDGFISRGCTEGRIDGMNHTDLCLGNNALRLQIDRCKREAFELDNAISDLKQEMLVIHDRIEALENISLKISDYNFSAPAQYASCESEREIKQKQLDSLVNDPEFIRAMEAAEIPKKNKEEADRKFNENESKILTANQNMNDCLSKLNDKNNALEASRSNYQKDCERDPVIAGDVDNVYADMLRSNGISDVRISELEARKDLAKENMYSAQAFFNSSYPDFFSYLGVDAIPIYKAEITRIDKSDIVSCIDRIDALHDEMGRRYREDYIKELSQRFKMASRYIKKINDNLCMPFGKDRYEIVLRPNDRFKAIFSECRRRNDGLLADTADDADDFEEFIRSMIEEITKKEMSIDDYADYRKCYDIRLLIHSFDGGREVTYDFQNKWGGASAGEVNTPLLILLAASLISLYDETSARMIFLDEAFPDISDDRVKPLMEYLKANNFQTIYCTHKGAGVIGMYVDTCIGCYQVRNTSYSYVEQMHKTDGGDSVVE